jgi:hypothetical protein
MSQRNRRAFWAEIFNRAERDLREKLKVVGRTRLGFWLALLVSCAGFSLLLFVWPFIGISWRVGLCIGVALLLFAISEAAFRTWRDLETAIASPGGLHAGAFIGGGVVHISPMPGASAYRISFSRTGEEAREVLADDSRTPHAVRFEAPKSEQFLKASELPYVLKTRDGRRRHRIIVQRFVPGGVVIDDRDAPLGRRLVCTLHFAERG